MAKEVLISVGVALSFLSVLASCTGNKEQKANVEKIVPVTIREVACSDAALSVTPYVGTVEELSASSISFQTAGVVQQVLASEGQQVKQGDLLAVLEKGTKESTYNAALSTLKQAQDAYDRLTGLYKNGSLPEIKYIEVQTSLEQAKAMANIAKKDLDDCHLYAPVSGVVGARIVETGVTALPGITAFKLIGVDRVKVKVAIPEGEISDIKEGQQADIRVTALGGASYHGQITEKSMVANPLTHTYSVKMELANPQHKLMPGMVCKVYIESQRQADSNLIVVPARAVQLSYDDRHFVWIAEGGLAKRRFVETGGLTDNGICIEQGLSAGDQLIVEGYQKVSEGMKITSNQQ